MRFKNMLFRSQSNTPVIFIPGLFGSMSDEIVPGTGKWHFGIASHVYDPFIKLLEKIGYELNKTLFISFYDWRKKCTYSAERNLLKTIEFVKRKTKAQKVNLIGHSMGGLVARAYVQSDFYNNDVEKLIILGTPNSGAAKAYYFWAGGEVPDDGALEDNIIEVIVEGYLWIFGKLLNQEEIVVIHNQFKGVEDLLPSKQYGDYLFYKEKNGAMIFQPYSKMKCKNKFLDRLNNSQNIIQERNIEVTLIGGTGEDTVKYLQIKPSNSPKLWPDGEVIGEKKSKDGDGTVMLKSVFTIEGDKYIIHTSHIGILLRSEYILRRKLLGDTSLNRSFSKPTRKYLQEYISLLLDGQGKIYLRESAQEQWIEVERKINLKSGKIYCESFSDNLRWIVIRGNDLKNIKIKYSSKGNEDIRLIVNINGEIKRKVNTFLYDKVEMEVV